MAGAHAPHAARQLSAALVLETPTLPRIASHILHPRDERARARHERVFDAWAWCSSDVLEWRTPKPLDRSMTVDSENPPELAFVFHEGVDCTFLPRELARFHARGYGLEEQWALAPYAIDDATDLLYERRVRPSDMLWLAASSLRALVWGLHDWAHFHNHGPFDEPALTELECDLVALEWLRLNKEIADLTEGDLATVAQNLASLSRARFAAEGRALPTVDLEALFGAPYPGPDARHG